MKKPADRLTIEPTTNFDPNILYLDFLYDTNIASLLETLAEAVCDIDENVTPARKKRTLAKNVYDTDKNVVLAGKKRTWENVILLSNKDITPAGKKRTWRKGKIRSRKEMHLREKRNV